MKNHPVGRGHKKKRHIQSSQWLQSVYTQTSTKWRKECLTVLLSSTFIKSFLSKAQWGFLQNHSVPDPITSIGQIWTENVRWVTFFDRKPAFDHNNHKHNSTLFANNFTNLPLPKIPHSPNHRLSKLLHCHWFFLKATMFSLPGISSTQTTIGQSIVID